MTQNNFSVGSQADLNTAIETIDSTTTAGTYTITLTGDITESGATGGLYVLSLAPGVVVDIDGANHTISGEALNEAFYGGLAVTTGTVSISDLTLKDTLARGGGGQGGGGAGLGGGLFVGPDAKVSLSDVKFVDDAAQGGPGGGPGTGNGALGGHSSLIYPALGGGGTNGTAGPAGTSSDTPGGDGTDGSGGGFGVAGGDGGGGGEGFSPGFTNADPAASDGGAGGKGGLGGIGGNGGFGGPGGGGGNGGFPDQAPFSGGDPGQAGQGGDGGDGGYAAGGGAGGGGGNGGNGELGVSGGPLNGVPSDGADGADGGKAGDGGFGGGGGAGGGGGTGGVGGTGQGVDGANGGAGGKGGDGGNGDFGGGGGGGGPGGNGGRAGPTNAGVGSPGSSGLGGTGGQPGLGGFGGGKGAAGSNGFPGASAEGSHAPGEAFGGAGGGGLGAGGAIFVADGGQLTVDGGLITGGTVVGGASGGPGAGAGSAYGSGMFIDGDTTVSLAAPTGTTVTISNVIADEQGSGGIGKGTLSIGAGGTVDLDATNTFAGGITIKGGTLELGAPGAAGTGQITFDASGDPTLLFPSTAAPSNPIAGLGLGDFIGVSDKTLSLAQYEGTVGGGPLVIDFAGGGSVTLNIVGSYQQADFPIIDNLVAVTCFLAGTAILGRDGEVAVERLRVGDMVMTQTDDGLRAEPVRWIGRRRVDPARHPRPCEVLPVCVRRGAFGNGVPRRDLFLSPNHAVFVDEVLIPVRYLIDGCRIRQMPAVGRITYFHIELDCHGVVLAEGLPCESYLETGGRRMFENGGVPVALHADFTALAWDALGYAPLVVTGPKLLAVRSRLAALAPLSLPVHPDADEMVSSEPLAEMLRRA